MQIKKFFRRLASTLVDDDVDDLAAMMTYYAIFALFPMLLFILSLTLLVLPADAVDSAGALITQALPADVASVVTGQLTQMQEASGAGFAIFGGLVALWGASRGTSALGNALNRVYSKPETRPWWRRQVRAVGITLMTALMVVVALGILAFGPAAGHAIADRFELGATFDSAWEIGQWIGAGLLMTLVWTLLYRMLPDTSAPLRVLTPGAAIGVILWIAASRGLALLLEYVVDFQATYGALAGFITFLLWLWLSNLALLVGAEINDVLAELRRHDSVAAAQLHDPAEHVAR